MKPIYSKGAAEIWDNIQVDGVDASYDLTWYCGYVATYPSLSEAIDAAWRCQYV